MAIELSIVTKAATKATMFAAGTDEFTLTAGKNLRVETSPAGEEVLNLTVPAGKSWAVSVTVSIAETDA